MKITNKELENVSRLAPFERYQYTIKKIADFEQLWSIIDETGDYALSDVGNQTFFSIWPAREYVDSNLSNGWEKCQPKELTLDEFSDQLLIFISENDYLINVFPINGKSGFVVNLEEFIRDLNRELEKYE